MKAGVYLGSSEQYLDARFHIREHANHPNVTAGTETLKIVYLHIGRGKTGTTTQQRYLGHNQAVLRAAGVHYILADGGGRGSGHQNFAKSFIADPPAYMIPASDPEGTRRAVAEEIVGSDAPTILISSENFQLAQVDAVAEWFASLPVPCKIRVIYFARSQDELAESQYNQMVKLKCEARNFITFIEEALEGVDHFDECERWASVFGRENIIVRIYDGAQNNASRQLWSCLPLADIEMPPAPGKGADYANRALGIRALVVARMLNRVEIENRDALYKKLFAAIATCDIPAVLFSSADARAFRTRFHESNRRFSETYLGSRMEDLGGRRYDDAARDAHFRAARALVEF
ncbi:MAG: hypothetical protein K5872_17500 [Rhizobiaceae bacterium]|nr:hypothetical protein [Rhizobiaceae bacterium]MCV0408021.1 hypothetical protein [Rhizobiaceae bacterium]